MTRYRVTWEQTVRYEIEVDAGSITDARTAIVSGRVERPRTSWTSDPRSIEIVAVPDDEAPSLFDMAPDPQPGAVGRDHPATSQAAARSAANRVRFGTQRYRVLEVLLAHGPATAATIADRLGMSRNQIATRLGECREAGWVDYARDTAGRVITAATSTDAAGMVQEITTAGWRAMTAARADKHDGGAVSGPTGESPQ